MLGLATDQGGDEPSTASVKHSSKKLNPIQPEAFSLSTSSFSSTPGLPNKSSGRANSQFGNKRRVQPQNSFETQEKPSERNRSTKGSFAQSMRTPIRDVGSKNTGKRVAESDSDVELFEDMVEKQQLDSVLVEMGKKKAKEDVAWKNNFFYKFLE